MRVSGDESSRVGGAMNKDMHGKLIDYIELDPAGYRAELEAF